MKIQFENIKPIASLINFNGGFLSVKTTDKDIISKKEFIEDNSKDFDDCASLSLLTGLLLGCHKVDLYKNSQIKNKLGYLSIVLATIFMILEISQKYLLSKIYDYKNKNPKS